MYVFTYYSSFYADNGKAVKTLEKDAPLPCRKHIYQTGKKRILRCDTILRYIFESPLRKKRTIVFACYNFFSRAIRENYSFFYRCIETFVSLSLRNTISGCSSKWKRESEHRRRNRNRNFGCPSNAAQFISHLVQISIILELELERRIEQI